MALQLNTRRSLVSWKLAGAFFAIFAFLLQPMAQANVLALININEVMANPVEIGEATTEWVELKNSGDTPVDISGWVIDGATISAGKSIAAGGLFVLCKTAEATTACDDVNSGLGLTNTGETLVLKNTGGDVVDEFTYTSSNNGQSIEVVKENGTTTGVNNATDAYDTNQTPPQSGNTGTPGAANRALPTATAVTNTETGETYDTLQLAVSDANSGDALRINENLSLSSQVTINKPLIINGNGHILSPMFTKTDNDNNSAIGVIGTGSVVISNLTIEGSGGTTLHGINIYESDPVTLNSLTITNNDNYAVVVNGSNVTVNSITTSGNGWGGINVDRAPASLTMEGMNSQTETLAVYVEDPAGTFMDNSGQYTEWIPGSGIYQPYVYDSGDSNFLGNEKYIQAGNTNRIGGQVRVPGATSEVRFSFAGVTNVDNVSGYEHTQIGQWPNANGDKQFRVNPSLPAGEYTVSAEYKVGSSWYDVTGSATVYSIDAPWAEYVVPKADQSFRPNDLVVRIKADDEFNQFKRMEVTLVGLSTTTHVVLRADCSDKGAYVLCDLSGIGLAEGAYKAFTTTYTQANNRVNNLPSEIFTIDSTAPVMNNVQITNPTGPVYMDSITIAHHVIEANAMNGVEFYVTKPRSDGACDPNQPKVLGPIQATFISHNAAAGTWYYRTTVDTSSLNGTNCIFSVAEDGAMNHSNPQVKKISAEFDNAAPNVQITNPANGTIRAPGGTITVRGTVDDAHPMNSFFRITGPGGYEKTSLFTDGRTTHEYAWDTAGLADGTYTIQFEARDSLSNKDGGSVTSISIVIDGTAPALSNLSAVQNADSTYTLSATTNDPASAVTFRLDGVDLIGATSADGGTTWTAITGVLPAESSHTFSATSTDAAGNTSAPAASSFTVPPIDTSGPTSFGGNTEVISTLATTDTTGASLNGDANVAQSTTGDVLGTEDEEGDVLGAADEETAAISPSDQGWKLWGVAWYWWVLALAAVAAAGWWLWGRRRASAEEF